MKIKSIFCAALCAAGVLCSFAGCSDNTDNSSENPTPSSSAAPVQTEETKDIAAVADKLKSDIKYDDELVELPAEKIKNTLSISEDKYTKAKVYICASGATPEEVDCFEAKDENAAEEIKAALESRVEKQKKAFENYNAEQAPKLDEPVIVVSEKNVFMCISGDNAKAKEIIG